MTLTDEDQTPPREEQRAWERRTGVPVAAIAFVSALFVVVGFVYQVAGVKSHGKGSAASLRTVHENASKIVTIGVLESIGLILLPVVLWYLYRVTRYRRAELRQFALYLAVGGGVALAVLQVLRQVEIVHVARQFVHLAVSAQTNSKADDLAKHGSLQAYGLLGLLAGVVMGAGLVLINLNAMRAGVITRFLGILGMIMGVLYVLPIGPPQLLQLFWLGGLGVIFLDRWPGGRGPAWDKMVGEPWPSGVEQRMAKQTAAGNGSANVEPEPAARPRSRKRKKRR